MAIVGSQQLAHVVPETAIFEVTDQMALCLLPVHLGTLVQIKVILKLEPRK